MNTRLSLALVAARARDALACVAPAAERALPATLPPCVCDASPLRCDRPVPGSSSTHADAYRALFTWSPR